MKAEIDIEKLESYLEGVGEHVAKSRAAVEDLRPEDHADYEAVCGTLLDVRAYEDKVAEEKAAALAEAKKLVEEAEARFRGREDEIAEHVAHLKGLVRDYAIAGEAKRKAQLAKAAALAKKDPKKARELQASADDWLAPKVKGIAFSGKLAVEVSDPKKLDRSLFTLQIDKAKLAAAAEAAFAVDEELPGAIVTDARTVRVTPSQRVAK
jgi:hypothetical protein